MGLGAAIIVLVATEVSCGILLDGHAAQLYTGALAQLRVGCFGDTDRTHETWPRLL